LEPSQICVSDLAIDGRLSGCPRAADVLVALLENDAGPFSVPRKFSAISAAAVHPFVGAAQQSFGAAVEKAAAGFGVSAGYSKLRARPIACGGEPHTLRQAGRRGPCLRENAFNISGVADRFEAIFAKARSRADDEVCVLLRQRLLGRIESSSRGSHW